MPNKITVMETKRDHKGNAHIESSVLNISDIKDILVSSVMNYCKTYDISIEHNNGKIQEIELSCTEAIKLLSKFIHYIKDKRSV